MIAQQFQHSVEEIAEALSKRGISALDLEVGNFNNVSSAKVSDVPKISGLIKPSTNSHHLHGLSGLDKVINGASKLLGGSQLDLGSANSASDGILTFSINHEQLRVLGAFSDTINGVSKFVSDPQQRFDVATLNSIIDDVSNLTLDPHMLRGLRAFGGIINGVLNVTNGDGTIVGFGDRIIAHVPNGTIKLLNASHLKSGQVASEFLMFPNLPQETKDTIWKYAIWQNCVYPRILGITEVARRLEKDGYGRFLPIASGGIFVHSNGLHHDFVVTGQLVPKFLAEGHAYLRQIALLNGYDELKVAGSSDLAMFCPDMDLIHLNSTNDTAELLLWEVIDIKFVQNIQALELNGGMFINDSKSIWLMLNIVPMTNLKVLRVGGEITLFPGALPGSMMMMMDFVHDVSLPLRGKHFIPVIVSPRGLMFGSDAIDDIALIEHGEGFRFRNIWDFLELLAKNCDRVPSRVTVSTRYEVLDFGDDDIFF